jgi:hypothetical protein
MRHGSLYGLFGWVSIFVAGELGGGEELHR